MVKPARYSAGIPSRLECGGKWGVAALDQELRSHRGNVDDWGRDGSSIFAFAAQGEMQRQSHRPQGEIQVRCSALRPVFSVRRLLPGCGDSLIEDAELSDDALFGETVYCRFNRKHTAQHEYGGFDPS